MPMSAPVSRSKAPTQARATPGGSSRWRVLALGIVLAVGMVPVPGSEPDAVATPPGGDPAREKPALDATPRRHDAGERAYRWELPVGFPPPRVPPGNPMTEAKVELGRLLFYDTRLSADGGSSCATCHRPELAFTDGRALARGSTGQLHPRSAPTLTNVAYNRTLGWADPHLESLEEQAEIPLFNTRPVELGMAGRDSLLIARLVADGRYRQAFARAFPSRSAGSARGTPPSGGISVERVRLALASFVRILISGDSPYDRWVHLGDPRALSASAVRGKDLFFSERVGCSGCHRGFNLSGPVRYAGSPEVRPEFHNTGLYDIDGAGGYPPEDTGLHAVTGHPGDMGRFRIPTLRNVAMTAPYMHDGSFATLEQVIDFYARGGREIASGLHSGDGRGSRLKSEEIHGFDLTARERQDLVAFLRALTDQSFLEDPRFSDPWHR